VWLLQREGARCVSEDWARLGLRCLARGPDLRNHIYAGGDNLHGTRDLFTWAQVPLPAGATTVFRVETTSATRRIFIGCDNGLFWSEIPWRFDDPRGYNWVAATGMPMLDCTGLSVWSSSGDWSGWSPVPPDAAFGPSAPFTTVSRFPQQLDLFSTGGDGRVYSTWWPTESGRFAPWFVIGAAGDRMVPGSGVAGGRTFTSACSPFAAS
jgi:hypothetical protein